jgi:hypothetical protein
MRIRMAVDNAVKFQGGWLSGRSNRKGSSGEMIGEVFDGYSGYIAAACFADMFSDCKTTSATQEGTLGFWLERHRSLLIYFMVSTHHGETNTSPASGRHVHKLTRFMISRQNAGSRVSPFASPPVNVFLRYISLARPQPGDRPMSSIITFTIS